MATTRRTRMPTMWITASLSPTPCFEKRGPVGQLILDYSPGELTLRSLANIIEKYKIRLQGNLLD